jgi:DNA-binding beta-propeller fold protein YncE
MLICAVVGTGVTHPAYAGERAAGKPDASAAAGPVWPPPPEPARIRFIKSVDGASDWGVARSWWGRMVDTITGRHETQFVRPTGVAERDGVLYVADPGAQCVVVFDALRHKEQRITQVGDRTLVSPVAVTPGPGATVYVVDSWLRQVFQLDRMGNVLRTIAQEEMQRPSSIAYDAVRHRLYVGDAKAHVVHVFDEQGNRISSLGKLGAEPGEFNSPTHRAVAPNGDVVVTDALNFRIEVFGTDGVFISQFGRIGDGSGNFAAPKGVAVDRAGHIYVADAMFDAVQVFEVSGRLLLGFGQQGNQAGQFWIPNGLYVGANDRLFVADAYNRRIQVFQIVDLPGELVELERGAPR